MPDYCLTKQLVHLTGIANGHKCLNYKLKWATLCGTRP